MTPLEIVVKADASGVKPELQQVQAELGKTAVAAKKADESLSKIGTGSNTGLSNVTAQLGKTAMAAQQTDSSLGKLSGTAGVAGRAFSGLASNLASGGIALAGAALLAFAAKLYEVITAEKEAVKIQNTLNETMGQAAASTTSQVIKLQALVEVARNAALSTETRQKAINKINKDYPEYLGNLTLETVNTDSITKSIDQQVAAIKRLATAKALSSLVDKTAEKLEEAKRKSDANAPSLFELFLPGTLMGVKKEADNISDLTKELDAYSKALLEADKSQITLAGNDPNAPKVKVPKAAKGEKTNPFDISLKDLEDNYKRAQALLVEEYHANLTNAKANGTAINDFVLKAALEFEEKKLALIKQYGKKQGDSLLQIAKVNESIRKNQLEFFIDQMKTLSKIQNAPALNLKSTKEKVDTKPVFEMSDAIKKNIKLQKEQLDLMNATANVLSKTVGPAFDTLFTGILDGSTNAFQAFGEALKQIIVQLGAAVLKAALFAAILSIINPASAVGGAVGGVSGASGFGAIFKKLLGFANGGEVKGYAGGGAIQGPGSSTSDSILARVSRGEYIMNAASVSKFGASFFDGLNRGGLPGFAGGGPVGSNMIVASQSNVFIPSVTVKGQDLVLVFNRANQRISRNG